MDVTPHVIGTGKKINTVKELSFTYVSIILLIIGFVTYASFALQTTAISDIEAVAFSVIMVLLAYGAFVYAFTRLGFLHRLSRYKKATEEQLDSFLYENNPPTLSILIPSYKEQPDVVYQALFSSAIQQYPGKNVVLLIDNPAPTNDKDKKLLQSTKKVVQDLNLQFHQFYNQVSDSRKNLTRDATIDVLTLIKDYRLVIGWLSSQEYNSSHTDTLFESINKRASEYLQSKIDELINSQATSEKIAIAYKILLSFLNSNITFFERKKYANLSHEANKAMNVNSYIHLMGSRWRESIIDNKTIIERDSQGPIIITHSDLLITLDADSLITHDYAKRLAEYVSRPGKEKVAVIQTPYSSIPNANRVIERLAGATTDIQYIIHQGFTMYEATYWVGANAVLRKKALDDIAKSYKLESGYTVRKFISDFTVIEDTESTIDLVDKGWKLYNYPQRLSFSATPPDFGSLLIQRRRWANGGLLIMPKLLRHMVSKIYKPHYFLLSGIIRLHYLTSIAIVNVGTLGLLLFPFRDGLLHPGVILIALVYYLMYGRDLYLTGYSFVDTLRVYSLNLLLVPVNLGGVLKSVQQGLMRKKIPFGRTPKVGERTVAPRMYNFMLFAFPIFFCLVFISDIILENYAHAFFTSINLIAFTYAVHLTDVRASFRELIAGT